MLPTDSSGAEVSSDHGGTDVGPHHQTPDENAAENMLSNPTTFEVEPDEVLEPVARYGSALVPNGYRLTLYLIGQPAPPIVVSLDQQLTIGRYDSGSGVVPDIDLSDCQARERGVSRRHALLLVEEDVVKVMDLGSANATYLNGQKLIPFQARILRDGDELKLGNCGLRVGFM